MGDGRAGKVKAKDDWGLHNRGTVRFLRESLAKGRAGARSVGGGTSIEVFKCASMRNIPSLPRPTDVNLYLEQYAFFIMTWPTVRMVLYGTQRLSMQLRRGVS